MCIRDRVFIPQEHRATVPEQARVVIDEQTVLMATLRELSAAADPVTRTWRARYILQGESLPQLGSIVRLQFDQPGTKGGNIYRVPVGAVSERGDGARLWVIVDNRVTPQPVQVLRVDTEDAYVATTLPAGTLVVALGTHLLTDGQVVRAAER